MGAAMLRRIFGCRFPTDMGRAEYVEMHDAFMKVIARDFINESAVIATLNRGDIGGKISDLITFSDTSSAQTPWERLGNVKISNSVAEVDDLESMLKALSSCIAMPLLYGHDYLQRTPNVLEDWDCFASNAVSLLALGIPSWVPIPSFQRGIAARGRLLESLAGVYRRIRQHHEGEPVDFGADMSDVSETVLDRYKVFAKHRLPVETIAQIELSLLWAQNKNTQQLLVWYVFYVYSVPGLLEALRREISASGAISMSGDSSSRITSVDIPSLSKDCLLLRSCFLESFRLAEESVMFRKLTQPVKMDVDVKNDSQVELPAGSWVTISNCRTKHVPSLYPIPLEFVPDRFIVEEEDGRRAVTYGPLRPWGIGPGMCKGRTFAEKQLLAVVACIATLWDMESVDLNSDRSWRHPGFKTGATVMAPGGKMRVRIKQRSTTKY
ncbi:cytochrome P450 [Naviculisporaceae sp. PSN 640]